MIIVHIARTLYLDICINSAWFYSVIYYVLYATAGRLCMCETILFINPISCLSSCYFPIWTHGVVIVLRFESSWPTATLMLWRRQENQSLEVEYLSFDEVCGDRKTDEQFKLYRPEVTSVTRILKSNEGSSSPRFILLCSVLLRIIIERRYNIQTMALEATPKKGD